MIKMKTHDTSTNYYSNIIAVNKALLRITRGCGLIEMQKYESFYKLTLHFCAFRGQASYMLEFKPYKAIIASFLINGLILFFALINRSQQISSWRNGGEMPSPFFTQGEYLTSVFMVPAFIGLIVYLAMWISKTDKAVSEWVRYFLITSFMLLCLTLSIS